MPVTLHCTASHLFLNHHYYLKNIFYVKTLSTQKFQKKCITSSIYFNFWKTSQTVFICLKKWNVKCVKYVKYAWKTMCEICSKSTIKEQKQCACCCSCMCLYCQLQKLWYWESSQTSTIKLFCKIVNRQRLKFSTRF